MLFLFLCLDIGRNGFYRAGRAHLGNRNSGIVLGAYTRLQKRRRTIKVIRHTQTKTATGMKVVPSFCIDDPLLLVAVLSVPPEEPFRADPCLGS